jgi:endoglucanase
LVKLITTMQDLVAKQGVVAIPRVKDLSNLAGSRAELTVMGTGLVDSNGDPVQLKGVSSMWLNWEDNGFAESADAILWMRDHWNLSVIRAAMGVEPSGAYMTNPDKAKAQVDRVVPRVST